MKQKTILSTVTNVHSNSCRSRKKKHSSKIVHVTIRSSKSSHPVNNNVCSIGEKSKSRELTSHSSKNTNESLLIRSPMLRSSVIVPDEVKRFSLFSMKLLDQNGMTNDHHRINTKRKKKCSRRRVILFLLMIFTFIFIVTAILLVLLIKPNNNSTMTSTIAPICTPFWSMPSSDQGTNFTYFNVNTQISGHQSRSGCVLVRASTVNVNNIVFDIGSDYNDWSPPSGCNTHFALSIIDSGHVSIYGMCNTYDNDNIATGQTTLYDGNFHQICATYDSTNAQLCIYQDLFSRQCLIRTNPLYNTSLGSVRVGWWPDGNCKFLSSGGGSIRSISLFSTAINQSCVSYLYQQNTMTG